MHTALQLREILECIFMHSDDSTNAIAARVCRNWSEPALNQLWKETKQTGLVPLLEILSSPLGWGLIGRELEDEPTFSQWQRFATYAKRVQKISYNDASTWGYYRIESSVFDSIAYLRPASELLFPKIRTLDWTCYPSALKRTWLFSAPDLNEFLINVPSSYSVEQLEEDDTLEPLEARHNSAFLRNIPHRTPNLTEFYFRCASPIGLIEQALVEGIKGLSKLKIVTVSAYHLSPVVFNELSKLATLEQIRTGYALNTRLKGRSDDIANFDGLDLSEGAFPSLKRLQVDMTLACAIRMTKHQFFPKALTNLHVSTIQQETIFQITDFFDAVPQSCPNLTHLGLNLFISNPPYAPTLDITHLRRLTSCKRLVHIMLSHNIPLQLSLADIDEIARNMPQLQSLYLAEDPIVGAELDGISLEPTLTLEALLPFAEHCPKLEDLGLFIDATKTSRLPPVTSSFKKLKRLHVGSSPITTSPMNCLQFLADICPEQVSIHKYLCWTPEFVSGLPDGVEAMVLGARREIWDKLEELHRAVVWYRRRDPVVKRLKDQLGALREEVQELKREKSVKA